MTERRRVTRNMAAKIIMLTTTNAIKLMRVICPCCLIVPCTELQVIINEKAKVNSINCVDLVRLIQIKLMTSGNLVLN